MRLLGLLVVVLLLILGVLLERAALPSDPPVPAAESPSGTVPQQALKAPSVIGGSEGMRSELAASSRASPEDSPEAGEPILRVRVLDAISGEPIPDALVRLEFAGSRGEWLEELPGGLYVHAGEVRPGTVLLVRGPDGWRVDGGRLELDAAPVTALVFWARKLAAGIVRGLLVDELHGRPLALFPFVLEGVDGETLVTDRQGHFASEREHPAGRLRFAFGGARYDRLRSVFGEWRYDIRDWHPAERLVVPARVGPRVFVRLDEEPEMAGAGWSPLSSANGSIRPLRSEGIGALLLEPVAQIHFRYGTECLGQPGEIFVWSVPKHLYGRAPLSTGTGTLEAPLGITLSSCGFLHVNPRPSRVLDGPERERIDLVCIDDDGVRVTVPLRTSAGLAVLEDGEVRLEVWFDGELLGSASVAARVGERKIVPLPFRAPTPIEADLVLGELHEVSGTVTSVENRSYSTRLRLSRLSDGEETLADVEWSKDAGVWSGTFDCRAPIGEHRAFLEIEPAFPVTGPQSLSVPLAQQLRFTIDDTAALVDFYFEPTAVESGARLLSIDTEALLERGDWLGGGAFMSSRSPFVEGHPRKVPFDWMCRAAGRRPVGGRWEPDGGEGDVVIPVVLERGWGVRLYVGDQDGYGLEGVRVFADGLPVGITRPSGTLCLGGERPERLAFKYRDWELDPENDSWVARDGTFEEDEGFVWAYIAPPRKR